MSRLVLLTLLVFAGSAASRGQLLTGAGAFLADVGLTSELATGEPTCEPCASFFPAVRAGFVSARWDLGAVMVGPSFGDAPAYAGASGSTLVAFEGRRFIGAANVGARALHSAFADGDLTTATLFAGGRPADALTIEAGAGPMIFRTPEGSARGWNALVNMRYADGQWAAWAEIQGTRLPDGDGGAVVTQVSYSGFTPTLSFNLLASTLPFRDEGAPGPGGPPGGPPFVTAGGSGALDLDTGFVQGTIGAEWPLVQGLRLLTEAGARTDSEFGTRGIVRAGIRLSLGPWTTGGRPASRWQVRPHRAELTIEHPPGERLYLVGDFNDWAEPGLPFTAEGRVHRIALELPPGTYAYKVALDSERGRRWLALPPELATEQDGFGTLNGVLVITG